MKKQFLKVLTMVSALFTAKNFDGKEQIELSEEDLAKIDAESGQEGLGEAFMEYFNEKYVPEKAEANNAFSAFMEQFNASGIGVQASEDEEEEEADAGEVPTGEDPTLAQKLSAAAKAGQKLLKTNAQLAADNEKLKVLPEGDKPEAVITINGKNQNVVKHSKSHLFASGQAYDAIDETRPWNRRAAEMQGPGQIKGATTWDKVNIDKLNADLGAYARRNSSEIMSMILDGYDVPPHWNIISNVQDQYVFTSIATGEITQAFKKGWLPKNKQRFVPVKNTIFDKQIDITWEASELKSIEKSWLNMFFNEGSTPYKMSFAGYLLSEILKRARKEDKINMFKGVYSDPALLPDGVAGSFMNAMNGFLKLVSNHRGVDYLPHSLAKLTPANTYDVLQDWIENKIPIDVRNLPGLKLGCGRDVERWYHESRELKKGTNTDYSRTNTTIEKFPNIEFDSFAQLEGTGFVYLTTDDNIGVMVDRPGEESALTIELDKRAINVFGDYKHGIYFKAFGAKVDPNAALDYEDQIFFSNDVELVSETYVPVAANDATPSVEEHNALVIGANNTAATDITAIDDVVAGEFYFLYGNPDGNVSTVKNNANIVLQDGDFALETGNLLVLVGQPGDKVLEYERLTAATLAAEEKVVLAADATTADAADGNHFITSANTGATAFTNIENAIEDEEYTLEGGSDTDSTTVANGGNFVLTAAFAAGAGNFLKVKFNGTKFVETARG